MQSVSAATAAAAMIQPVAGPSVVSDPPLSLVTTDQVSQWFLMIFLVTLVVKGTRANYDYVCARIPFPVANYVIPITISSVWALPEGERRSGAGVQLLLEHDRLQWAYSTTKDQVPLSSKCLNL